MEALSIKECFSAGWKTFWARPWLFVLAGLVVTGISLLFSIPDSIISEAADKAEGTAAIAFLLLSLASFAANAVVSTFLQMGTTRFTLKAHDDVTGTRLKDLLYLEGFWRYVATSALSTLAVIAGLILLVVPGVIIALALSFALYLVIDRGMGPIESMKESFRITKGKRWKLFLLALAVCGANILGFLALVLGLAVSIPVTMLASAHAFRVLAGGTGGSVTEAPVEAAA